MITTIVSFIVVFGLLVFVHELGHFLTAKRAGVKIEEFAFGYPPRLFAIQRGGINYALNLIPFGGYVRMQGEDDPNAPEGLASKPRPWRALVLSAGALMNVLLAIVLFTGVYIIGEPVPTAGQVEIGEVQPGSPAAMAGLQAGDVILRLDDQEINVVNDVSTYTRSHLGTEIAMTVRRGTEPLTMRMTPRPEPPAGEGPLGHRTSQAPGLAAGQELVAAIVAQPWQEAPTLFAREPGLWRDRLRYGEHVDTTALHDAWQSESEYVGWHLVELHSVIPVDTRAQLERQLALAIMREQRQIWEAFPSASQWAYEVAFADAAPPAAEWLVACGQERDLALSRFAPHWDDVRAAALVAAALLVLLLLVHRLFRSRRAA